MTEQTNTGAPPTAEPTPVARRAAHERPPTRLGAEKLEGSLEQYRAELSTYCCRMLESPFEAEDAVQETLLRAWRGFDRFEGRSSLRSWLYRIATNVCLDTLNDGERRDRPVDLRAARPPEPANRSIRPKTTYVKPIPDNTLATDVDPAEAAVARETIRFAFVAALQYLPARQRAVLVLCEVLRWKATEAAQLLDTTVASVNSALQRARATLEASVLRATDPPTEVDDAQHALLARYVQAFEAYDIDGLTSLIKEDTTQSVSPYELGLHRQQVDRLRRLVGSYQARHSGRSRGGERRSNGTARADRWRGPGHAAVTTTGEADD